MEQELSLENEKEIVERAKTDDAAFEILYNHYLPKIYGYIYKRTGSRETTEDLVSTTFMKVFCNLQKYEHQGCPFGAWIYKIATNNLVDYYRKESKKKELNLDNFNQLASDGKNQAVEMDEFYNRKAVKWTLDQLPKKYQQVINLKFYAELDNTEISATLAITPNSAGVLIHRALKKFNDIYQTYSDSI